MDWFKYIWLVILIIVYIIWTVCAIKNTIDYIKKYGFKLGIDYAFTYSKWFDSWVCLHAVILAGLFIASFLYFLFNR